MRYIRVLPKHYGEELVWLFLLFIVPLLHFENISNPLWTDTFVKYKKNIARRLNAA